MCRGVGARGVKTLLGVSGTEKKKTEEKVLLFFLCVLFFL